ncbi:hypothetical protein P3F83_18625 [Mycobacteroides immunogenum]|uniref:hypothetical protein n=1 Tax=Mycobacteroides immunogenum TaxID=83262 RepID=UPI0025B784A7|nr:hypothetical protein [Mycobacteroides immunogenum]WJR32522.1 hypothetical protein P3F83_18625 [Mycobacteroides immunogenum]
MNTPMNYGDTLWRDAHGAFVVLPIAPPSLQTRSAVKPAVAAMSMAGSAPAIKHRAVAAAAANVASVNRGYI